MKTDHLHVTHLNIHQVTELPQSLIEEMVTVALEEDIGSNDITAALIPVNKQTTAILITREAMVVCGCAFVAEVFQRLVLGIKIEWHVSDQDYVPANTTLLTLQGDARSILTAERTALNFLQMLSGVATSTKKHMDLIAHTNCQILDTRKTIPCFRLAQKYAVWCGGGQNHRTGLFDAFLIKENHIIASGGITRAVNQARAMHSDKSIEVEVENLDELKEALACKVDVVMLDNFTLEMIQAAVKLVSGVLKLEVSGNITSSNLIQYAETGVDYISMGVLTKNINAIDLSLRCV